MWVYVLSERWLDIDQQQREVFTVGFYKPDGTFESESDHGSKDAARAQVHYLNGGTSEVPPATFEACIESGIEAVQELLNPTPPGNAREVLHDWALQAADLLPDEVIEP